MTRKIGMLAVVFSLFCYTAWDFYDRAVSYDPLAEVTIRKQATKMVPAGALKYEQAWGKEIYEKNLFSPARGYVAPRPPAPPIPPAPPPPPPPRKPDMDLKGIIVEPSGDLVAILSIDKAKPVAMRKGDMTEGIELVDINERHVVLKWNGENIPLSVDNIKTITNPRMAR